MQIPFFNLSIAERKASFPLDNLPPDEELGTVKPTKQFIESLRREGGIWVPLILQRHRNGFIVKDGKRRIMAARKLGIETAPVNIYDEDAVLPSVLFNEQRSSNIADLFFAVRDLVDSGIEDAKEVSKKLNLPVNEVLPFIRMVGADPLLVKAWMQAKVADGTMIEAAKRSQEEQRKILEVIEQNGKVTRNDLKEIRRESSKLAVAQLDKLSPSIFADESVPPYCTKARAAGDGLEYELWVNGERLEGKLSVEVLEKWAREAA